MTTQQYREVKRKAAVGERIKVVNAWATGGLYENGDVFTVTETHAEHEGAVIGVAERLSAVGIVVGEYVVLEPVTESIAPSPLSADPFTQPSVSSSRTTPPRFAQFCRNLKRRVSAQEES